MNILLLGAGHIGRALVEALHEEHEVTVIDADPGAPRGAVGPLRRADGRGRRDHQGGRPPRGRGAGRELGGVDVAINPRQVTAEEMVRFAHDPRIRHITMLEGDRFEILDIAVRAESPLAGTSFKELPETGSVIGAVVRDGNVLFPHSSDTLRAGDRAIVFVESRRASLVERAL